MRIRIKKYIMLGVFAGVHMVQAHVTVGSGIGCDFNNLEDAYMSADNFMRVTTESAFTDDFVMNKPKWITGGYDDCADADKGIIGESKTKWRRFNDGTVVTINADQAGTSIIVLDNFEIFGGESVAFAGAGGIRINGNSTLLLSNSDVYDNTGDEGGGIRVRGEDTSLVMTNVKLYDNVANSAGGGIYCESGAKVSILGSSSINNNSTDGKGGGLFGNTSCEIISQSGDTELALQSQQGIRSNSANQGGGVYLQGGATMELMGNDDHPASIIFNLSEEESNEGGGGVYLTGPGTRLDSINGRIELNIASVFGAGASVNDQAILTMSRLNTPCWDNDRCSSLSFNLLTGNGGYGAAMDVYDASVANVSQTFISGNRGNSVAGMSIDTASFIRLEGNLITGNYDWNDDSDTSLFGLFGEAGSGGNLDFFYNTLIDNQAAQVFILDDDAQQTLNIHNSIIRNEGLTMNESGVQNNIVAIDCVFLQEQASLSGNIGTVLVGDPGFVDAANENYHLIAESDAIDFCDEQTFIGAAYNDLNGQVRGVDDPAVNNAFGPFDAGAYEANYDLIFKQGFE